MRFVLPAAALAVLAFALPAVAGAQSVPNLSGTWVLQLDKSDFGAMNPPQSRSDVIDHQEPKLTIKRTAVTAAGETSANLVYTIDGKPYKNTAGANEVTSVLHWEGQTLVMVSTFPNPQGEVTVTDRYTLSADGKTLTQLRALAIGAEGTTQTIVLAKQP